MYIRYERGLANDKFDLINQLITFSVIPLRCAHQSTIVYLKGSQTFSS